MGIYSPDGAILFKTALGGRLPNTEVSLLVFGKFTMQDAEPKRISPANARWPKRINDFFASHLESEEFSRFKTLFCEEDSYLENFSSLIRQTAENQAEILLFGRGNFTIPMANRMLHPYFPCVSVLYNIENNFGLFSYSFIKIGRASVRERV